VGVSYSSAQNATKLLKLRLYKITEVEDTTENLYTVFHNTANHAWA